VFVDEDGNGSVDRRRYYLTLLSVDRRVGFVDVDADSGEADWYYYLTDPAGSVVAVTDSDGNIVNRYDYDAFGNLIKDNSFENVPNRYQFHGRAYDEHRGDYHYRMRVYVPAHGRFSGPDMKIEPLTPNGACNYLFCRNNPLVYSDPWGLQPDELVQWLTQGVQQFNPDVTQSQVTGMYEQLPQKGKWSVIELYKNTLSDPGNISEEMTAHMEEVGYKDRFERLMEQVEGDVPVMTSGSGTTTSQPAKVPPLMAANINPEGGVGPINQRMSQGYAQIYGLAMTEYGISKVLGLAPRALRWLSSKVRKIRAKGAESTAKAGQKARSGLQTARTRIQTRVPEFLSSSKGRYAALRVFGGGYLNKNVTESGGPAPVPTYDAVCGAMMYFLMEEYMQQIR